MKIGDKQVGKTEAPFYIAEAGVNHNGDLEMAEKLIETAAEASADAVKFQTFDADQLVTKDASKAEYQKESEAEDGQHEMLRRYELSRSDHEHLISYCRGHDITFLSTPFDRESADMLSELGVPAIKLGSGELDNHPLLRHVAGLDLPMILSTGMGTMTEVEEAYEVIESANSDAEVMFLHCTSAYPCDVDDVNLRAMKTMDEKLPVPVGYSDHTTLPEMPAFAVSAGACIVEKHFTLDSTLPGPDHEASLEPDELARSVKLVRTASWALGSPEKEPVEAELENREVARKSLHAAKDIKKGTELSEADIKIVRPAEGMSPKRYQNMLGKKVTTELQQGEPLTKQHLNKG